MARIWSVIVKTVIAIPIVISPTLVIAGSKRPPVKKQTIKQAPLSCANALSAPAFLRRVGIGADNIKNWESQPDVRPTLEALAEMHRLIESAPPQALDLLATLSKLRLADEATEQALLSHLEKDETLMPVQVFIGKDLRQLILPMLSVYVASHYAPTVTHYWLKQLTRSPAVALLFANALAALPPISVVAIQQGSGDSMNLQMQRVFQAIVRMRPVMPNTLADLYRGSRNLTSLSVMSYFLEWTAREEKLKVINNITSVNALTLASTPDREAMVEWATDLLMGQGDPNAAVSPVWRQFYSGYQKFVTTPINRLPKFGSATVGDLRVIDILASLRRQIIEEGRLSQTSPDAPLGMQQVFEIGLGHGLFLPSQTHQIMALLGRAGGVTMVTGAQFKAALIQSMQSVGQEIAKLYPNVSAIEPETATLPSPASTNSAIDIEKLLQDSVADDQSQDFEDHIANPVVTQRIDSNSTSLEDFIEQRRPISDLQPDKAYSVSFLRPNLKFSGNQMIMFTKKALDEMLAYRGKDVEPVSWLNAIQQGLAASRGQRGIKLLNTTRRKGEDLPFKVKLLLSTWRIHGHFHNGVWVLEHLQNDH